MTYLPRAGSTEEKVIILFGTDFDPNMTFQEKFPETMICDCAANMYPIVQIADDEGIISRRTHCAAKNWMHDSAIIVVYQCHACMKLKALYNQA